MDRLTPAQVRAARGMLDWSIVDMARAAWVSVMVVRRFESGGDQLISKETIALMQDAAETECVSFLVDDGNGAEVRLRRR